jgi:hypothetical protein
MDRLGLVRGLGIAGTVLGLMTTLRFATAPVIGEPTIPDPGNRQPNQTVRGTYSPSAADSLALMIALRNLFRADRAPASAPFDPDVAAGTAPAAQPRPPSPPRPTLTLVGLILGPEPAALVDGVPGAEGSRALRVGEGFAGYVVRAIGDGFVVITSADTTLTLRLRSHAP